MNVVEFGNYIKELRTRRKVSIRKLGMLTGVSNGYISQIERGVLTGTPKPDILRKLATHLNVTFEELMINAGHMDEPKNVMMDMIELIQKAKAEGKTVNLDQFGDYVFILKGKPVDLSIVKKMISDIAFLQSLTAPHNGPVKTD